MGDDDELAIRTRYGCLLNKAANHLNTYFENHSFDDFKWCTLNSILNDDNVIREIENITDLFKVLKEDGKLEVHNTEILRIWADELNLTVLAADVYQYESYRSGGFQKFRCNVWSLCKAGVQTTVLGLKTVLKTKEGRQILIGAPLLVLCNYKPEILPLIEGVFPVAMKITALMEGSICFRIETSCLSSLRKLWEDYVDGTLREKLEEVFNGIPEVRKFSDGEEVHVEVKQLDEEEYKNGLWHPVVPNLDQVKGEHENAIKSFQQQLAIAIETDNKEMQKLSYYKLGSLYEHTGDHDKAIEYYEKGLAVAVAEDDEQCQATAFEHLGDVYRTKGDYKEAIKYHERQLQICIYDKLVLFMIESHKYSEALGVYDKQIRIAESIKDKDQEGRGYLGKGTVYNVLGDYEQALYCYDKALAIYKATDNYRRISTSFHALAIVYMKMALRLKMVKGEQVKRDQYIAKSIHFCKENLTYKERHLDQLKNQDHFKVSYLEEFITTYNLLTLMLLTSGDHKEALLVSEQGRARALNDILIAKYNINGDQRSGSDRITYDEIQNMASDFSIIFYTRFRPGPGQGPRLCTWVICKGNVSSLFKECNFSNILESAYGALKVREVQCEDRSIQTDEHQQQHKVSRLRFDVTDDVSDELLLSACKMIKTRCIADEDENDDDDDDDEDPNPISLTDLHKSLISPVQDQLITDEIVIIPDGNLFKVPFAALRDPKTGKFLSETKRIRIAPSLISLKALQECPEDFHSKTGALIIGNPKVGKVMFRGETKYVSDLSCAEREAKMIGKLLGVKPFIGPQATKEAIKQNLRKGVAIIHFATHGTPDGEIILTPSTSGAHDLPSEQNYILTMKDVQESAVRPQLVVLSCCHSGHGDNIAEVVGMSQSFLAAGARAVVASLWAIADEATMVFMEMFYTHLKKRESASKSLQQAMKDMREIPRYSDPYYWAPFFLIGDDVTINM